MNQRLYPPPAPLTSIPKIPARRKIPTYVIVLLLGGAAFVAAFAVLFIVGALMIGGIYSSGNVLPGVTVSGTAINSVAVGSMSVDEAAAALKTISVQRPITLRDQMRTWPVTSADLGISVDSLATAAKAAQAGRENGDILTGIETMIAGTDVAPIYTIDLAKLQTFLTDLATKTNTKPDPEDINSTGRTLNISGTIDALPPNLTTLLDSGTLDLVMDVVQGPRTTYTVQRGEELELIAKKYNVAISDLVTLNKLASADTIYPGQELIIPAEGVWVPTEKDAPAAPLARGKSIVVVLGRQRIFAYEDGRLVHSSLMSSGLPGKETVIGDFKVYVKYASTRMRGPDYDIPNVPWTMYFYQGYGIHGAFWHNDFGRQMSHGCVNLDTSEAKWFFDFAPVGTVVRVSA